MTVTLAAALTGLLFFSAADADNGRELWASDGTTENTRLVADLTPGKQGTNFATPFYPVKGGVIFITSRDGDSTRDLYISDGTASGTRLLASDVGDFSGEANGNYYINTLSDPWFIFIKGSNPELQYLPHDSITFQTGYSRFLPLGEQTLIIAPPLNNFNGHNWLVSIHNPNSNTLTLTDVVIDANNKDPRASSLGDRFVYVNYTKTYGEELWISDGTLSGTKLLKDIRQGKKGSMDGVAQFQGPVTNVGKAYFEANDGVHGHELWATDGTEDGTELVVNLARGSKSTSNLFFTERYSNLFYNKLFKLGGLILLDDDAVNSPAFYTASDLEPGAKKIVLKTTSGQKIMPLDSISNIVGTPELAFFRGWKESSAPMTALYTADMSTGLTSLVKKFDSDGGCNAPWSLTVYKNKTYFSTGNKSDPDSGACDTELWMSDGTKSGTVLMKDIIPGRQGSSPERLAVGGAP